MKPMLAKRYDDRPPNGWWMSEKLDGVRAIWNGSKLISRSDNAFNAPQWFTESLPVGIVLDGELWEGRGLFAQTVGKVRTKYNPNWSGIMFIVFDMISPGTFEERQQSLNVLSLPQHIRILEQIVCKGREHLNDYEERIVSAGGEGVMLRRPGSLYEHKRSSALMKVKRFQTEEAVVAGYEQGKGRNSEVVGSLICRFDNKTIQVGTGLNDELRRIPPAVGSVVTISFFELTKDGMPRFPVYIGCRDYE